MRKLNRVADYDPTIERILKESADEIEILTSQMKEAYSIYMGLNVGEIRKKRPVLIENIGLFFLSPYKTEEYICKMFGSLKKQESGKDPEGITREEIKEKIKKYWQYHERARHHYIRTGKKYRAKLKRAALSRGASNSEQLQPLLQGGETERPAGIEGIS